MYDLLQLNLLPITVEEEVPLVDELHKKNSRAKKGIYVLGFF